MADLEAFFREMIRAGAPLKAEIGLTPENRVVLRVSEPEAAFTIVENTAIPYAQPQRVAAQGFDAHKGMGERA